MFQPGDTIDRYELVAPLGEGGMGQVWRAKHRGLRAPVALKLLRHQAGEDSAETARFLREARAAAQLRGRHVVQVFDVGIADGTPYIAMELLGGESLGARLKRRGHLAPDEVASILKQVGRAIARAHDAGVVHRDLKPANIQLVDEEGGEVVKVLDFGIAKLVEGGEGEPLTETGALIGTPHYMSPEQLRGAGEVDARCDLWAMAVIAFECLVGARPFTGETIADLIVRVCTEPAPVPSERGSVPSGFDAWFACATHSRASERFQSVGELVETLGEALGAVDEGRPASRDGERASSLEEAVTATAAAKPKTATASGLEALTQTKAPTSEAVARPASRARSSVLTGVGVGLVGGLVALGWWLGSGREGVQGAAPSTVASSAEVMAPASGEPAVPEATVPSGRPISFDGRVRSFSLSADGAVLAYTVHSDDGTDLFVKRGEGDSRLWLRRPAIRCVAVAPDGGRVAFCDSLRVGDHSRLVVVPTTGNPPEVEPYPDDRPELERWANEATWLEDGRLVTLPVHYMAKIVVRDITRDELEVLPLDLPSSWRYVEDDRGFELRRFVRGLSSTPDSKTAMLVSGDGDGASALVLQPLDGTKARVIDLPGLKVLEAHMHHERLYLSVGNLDGAPRLLRVPLDAEGLPVGEPEPVYDRFQTADGHFALFERGLAFLHVDAHANLWRFDRRGDEVDKARLTTGTRLDVLPSLSPDGRRVAFIRRAGHGPAQLHVRPLGDGSVRRVSDMPAVMATPAWSPDGEQLAFVANQGGTPKVWLTGLTGAPRPLEPSVDLASDRAIHWAPGPELLVHVKSNTNYARIDPQKGTLQMLLNDPAPVMIRFAVASAQGRVAAFRAGKRWGLSSAGPDGWQLFAPRRVIPLLGWTEDESSVFARDGDQIVRFDVTTGEETPWLDLDAKELAGVTVSADGGVAVASIRQSIRDVHVVSLR